MHRNAGRLRRPTRTRRWRRSRSERASPASPAVAIAPNRIGALAAVMASHGREETLDLDATLRITAVQFVPSQFLDQPGAGRAALLRLLVEAGQQLVRD